MPITESNSPWIKASEQPLPTSYSIGGRLCVKFKGTADYIYFAGSRWNWPISSTPVMEYHWQFIEWLDEEKLSRMVAELEAKDKEIERLKGLMQGQAYSIWKGCGSELSFDEWNKKFQHNL